MFDFGCLMFRVEKTVESDQKRQNSWIRCGREPHGLSTVFSSSSPSSPSLSLPGGSALHFVFYNFILQRGCVPFTFTFVLSLLSSSAVAYLKIISKLRQRGQGIVSQSRPIAKWANKTKQNKTKQNNLTGVGRSEHEIVVEAESWWRCSSSSSSPGSPSTSSTCSRTSSWRWAASYYHQELFTLPTIAKHMLDRIHNLASQ